MKRSTVAFRSALQLATLFLAAAPVTFGGEPGTSQREPELIGHMVVTAAPERPFIGHMVVTATQLARTNTRVADLGAMTVTAQRVTTLARN